MRFSDLNWFDVEKYLEKDDRLMLVLGACEQHAYLSLLTDVSIPMALADAASKFSGVLIAPSLPFGVSPYFDAYPGTISLRAETFLRVVEDMVRAVYRYGFRRLLILNGHGGNDLARARLQELLNELNDLQVNWYAWFQSHAVLAVAEEHDLKPAHANWLEAFPFTMVASVPGEKKNPPHVPGLRGAKDLRMLYGDGSFGGEYQVGDEIMDEIFQAALEDVLRLIRFEE